MPDELEQLREKTLSCDRCVLSQTRNNVVFGHGNPDADIVFVGEAPGFNEDKQGLPFVGAAGKLLTELLASIGISREDVYIANVLKCRPPGNRDPLPEEIAVCKPILFAQLSLIKPRVVVTLGAHASRTILGRDISISKIHGQVFEADGFTVFPIYHPAAALYARATKEYLEEDFRKLKAFLAEKNDMPYENKPPNNAEDAEQLGLF